jgi:hypothetical protein
MDVIILLRRVVVEFLTGGLNNLRRLISSRRAAPEATTRYRYWQAPTTWPDVIVKGSYHVGGRNRRGRRGALLRFHRSRRGRHAQFLPQHQARSTMVRGAAARRVRRATQAESFSRPSAILAECRGEESPALSLRFGRFRLFKDICRWSAGGRSATLRRQVDRSQGHCSGRGLPGRSKSETVIGTTCAGFHIDIGFIPHARSLRW